MSNWVGWSSSHSAGNKKLNNFYYTFQHKNSGTTTRWNFSFFRVLCCVILWHGIDRVKEYSKAKPDTIITSFKNLTICVSGYYPGACRLPQFTTTYGGAVSAPEKQYQQYWSHPWQTPSGTQIRTSAHDMQNKGRKVGAPFLWPGLYVPLL